MQWISENLSTIIVSVILIAVVSFIIYRMIKNKKEGRSSCGCGCQGCAMQGQCHRSPRENKQ